MSTTTSAFLFADRRERSMCCTNRSLCCSWCTANATRSITAPALLGADLDEMKPRGRPTKSGRSCQVMAELWVLFALRSSARAFDNASRNLATRVW
jgi:hypothetical protein